MIGIQLIASGEFLDLFPDTVINLQFLNPIFAENDIIPGSISLPFDVPGGLDSVKNMRLLSNPDQIEAVQTKTTFSARLYFDGVLYKTGNIQVVQPSGNKISINFIFGFATLANGFKNAKVRTICSKPYTISTSTYRKRVKVKMLFPTSDRTITVNGRDYTDSTSLGIYNQINADNTQPLARCINYNSGTGEFEIIPANVGGGAVNIDSPLTVEIPLDELGQWSVDASAFTSEWNDPIATWIANYMSATPVDSTLRFPMVRNRGMYTKAEKYLFRSADFNFINYSNGGTFFLNKPAFTSGIYNFQPQADNRTSIAPHVRLKWVIDTIASYFNIGLEGDFLDDPDYENILFTHSNSLDVSLPFISSPYFNSRPWLYCRRSFNANEFLPDYTVPDLLKAIQKRFNLAVYYNEKTGNLRLQKRETILINLPFTDITGLCEPINKQDKDSIFGQYFIDNSQGLLLQAKKNTGDSLAVDDSYKIGGGANTINTDFSGLYQQNVFPVGDTSGYIPNETTGMHFYNLPEMKAQAAEEIPSTFIFYAFKNNGDFDYPSANIALQDCDFIFSGSTGLALKRWKNYLRFLFNRQTVYTNIHFELRHLLDIDWEKKYRFDRVNYLISTLDVKLTMNGIQTTAAELYPTGVGVLP